ncbi:hypothetical protein N0V93_005607 [Gnomoniopsis smithogilvyi]|uniref:Peroxin 11C n=1 Tax=Gnomoniopsis smithogilvyi TaxID=1191159 RepID=A0A9W8YT60_9PEZI|nr:hypothetical protein N0V93_005607 [Gnomoniopsis smithogilvyi]
MSESTPEADNPIDLPTGEPIPAPAAPSSSSKPDSTASFSKPTRPFTATSLATKTDAFLTHLQRCLATPSGIDTLLLFICYTSRLTGALSTSLSQSLLRRDLVALALTLPRKQTAVLVASSNKSPRTLAIAQLAAVLGARLKSLGSLASEARTIARLWGLLGMYFWAKRLTAQLLSSKRSSSSSSTSEKAAAAEPQESKLATLVSWAQLISCTAFQYLENGAYLSGKGVLGWTPKEQGRAYVVSARWLAVYTGLEIGKLLAAIVARRDVKAESEDEKAEMEAVRRSMVINLAWTPLTLHWAADTGFLSDLAVGLGGSIPGVIQMRKLWRETA